MQEEEGTGSLHEISSWDWPASMSCRSSVGTRTRRLTLGAAKAVAKGEPPYAGTRHAPEAARALNALQGRG